MWNTSCYSLTLELAKMKTVIAFLLVAFNVALFASCQHSHGARRVDHGPMHVWVEEFGTPGEGKVICRLEGHTHKPHTEIPIPVPSEERITYVKVTVRAESKPRINYDKVTRSVCIDFQHSEKSESDYDIVVEGVPAEGK